MIRMLELLAIIFLILTMVMNITPNSPKFPWDINIDKLGIKVYIPIISSLVLSALISMAFNLLK